MQVFRREAKCKPIQQSIRCDVDSSAKVEAEKTFQRVWQSRSQILGPGSRWMWFKLAWGNRTVCLCSGGWWWVSRDLKQKMSAVLDQAEPSGNTALPLRATWPEWEWLEKWPATLVDALPCVFVGLGDQGLQLSWASSGPKMRRRQLISFVV